MENKDAGDKMHKRITERIREAIVKAFFSNNDDFKRLIALELQVKWLSERVRILEESSMDSVYGRGGEIF